MEKGKGLVFWFTGRSNAGKTTLVTKICTVLEKDVRVQILDMDDLRPWLVSGVSFSKNMRRKFFVRIIEIAKILSNQNVTVLVVAVKRYHEFRNLARKSLGDRYHEIYVKCSLETCIKRYPKNFSMKKSLKQIQSHIKIFDFFEEPLSPDFVIDTEHQSVNESLKEIHKFVDSLILKRY